LLHPEPFSFLHGVTATTRATGASDEKRNPGFLIAAFRFLKSKAGLIL
jgi:hypothetical protein